MAGHRPNVCKEREHHIERWSDQGLPDLSVSFQLRANILKQLRVQGCKLPKAHAACWVYLALLAEDTGD